MCVLFFLTFALLPAIFNNDTFLNKQQLIWFTELIVGTTSGPKQD